MTPSIDRATSRPRPGPCISVVTLGCPKNLVDSEIMLGRLHEAGFRATVPEEADLIVVNTCAFLTTAQRESIDTILTMARLKETGGLKALIVAGCLPQRHGASVLEELPEVDYLLGPGTCGEVVSVARGLLEGVRARGAELDRLDQAGLDWEGRVLSDHAHTAYLKISEGCSRSCSFCVIPRLRGPHRSRAPQDVEAEARHLAAAGVRELTLVAQDTTSYGFDLDGRPSLAGLLTRLDRIDGIRWIRLLYTYPGHWSRALVECFGRLEKLVPYVDIPIQHAADAVLARMRRGGGWKGTERLLRALRERVPGMVLRTTILTGFPGETEREFEVLLARLREIGFDHLGAFAYSAEEGTAAAELPGVVPEDLRLSRRDRVLMQQRAISLARNRARIGQCCEVLVDSVEQEKGIARGRWFGQALDIDGQVIISLAEGMGQRPSRAVPRPGEFVLVRVRGAGPYDLVGTLEPEEER